MGCILIVEDDKMIQRVLTEVFHQHTLVFALEREEVEAAVPLVDLVICDYHFNPRLSFEQVRDIVAGRVPVILYSGSDEKLEIHSPSIHKLETKKLRQTVSDFLKAAA